ncbi:MAG: hypothetical protein ACOYL5_06450 [Phototrophicaceae bacterium]|jgi:hypothetical protein
MESPLPSNESLIAYSQAIGWKDLEHYKRAFNQAVKDLANDPATQNTLPLDTLSKRTGITVQAAFDPTDLDSANVLFMEVDGHRAVLGSYVNQRYRRGKSVMGALVPYNLNPSVHHLNLAETANPATRMQALGAELELGLLHRDGSGPSIEEVEHYIGRYSVHARRLGITPQVDHEACQYQIETHVAPSVGYHRTRHSLDGIMQALVATSEETGLITAILSSYPTRSDFRMSPDPKVQSAVDLMLALNGEFPEFGQRLADANARYHVTPPAHHVEMFRNQGCHIHLDIAGRSEALGLFTFYTMLRSASAAASAAVLKGGPFVNGTCDAELLCTREYLRHTTITGNYITIPTSPHYSDDGFDTYANLLNSPRVNAVARAHLIDDNNGSPVSAMHNPLGRIRPDLGNKDRICTIESTGMPTNISAARMAAVLADFEFSHLLMEHYYRMYGTDLEPMMANAEMWAMMGPLPGNDYQEMHRRSDLEGTDFTLRVATGVEMSLPEFYERKRRFMHRALADVPNVTARSIDDVYTSLGRMLDPLGGKRAQTVEQYIADPKLRSTGNWGQILRDAYIEEGGVVGAHHPDAVLRVVTRVHDALRSRYLT